MTLFIDKLLLNLAIPHTLNSGEAKKVRGVLAVLPHLVRQELQVFSASLPDLDSSPTHLDDICLPDEGIQALLDSPTDFARSVAAAVIKAIYPNVNDVRPLPNTPLKNRPVHSDTPEQQINNMYQALLEGKLEMEDSLLPCLFSGMGAVLSAQQASLFCRLIIACLSKDLMTKGSASHVFSISDTYLASLGINRVHSGSFKTQWLNFLANPLVFERVINVLMKVAPQHNAVELLWGMLSDKPLGFELQALLQKQLQRRQDLIITMDYILQLSELKVANKGERLTLLLILQGMPELDPASTRHLAHIFLQSTEKKIIEAAKTWMNVAQIQIPSHQDKQVLVELERGLVLQPEGDVFSLDPLQKDRSSKQSALAKLMFWRKVHDALLALMQADISYDQLLVVLNELETLLTQGDLSPPDFLMSLGEEVVLLRLSIQNDRWPLTEQEGWLRASTLLKQARRFRLESLLSRSNPDFSELLSAIRTQLMAQVDLDLLALFGVINIEAFSNENRRSSLLEKTESVDHVLGQLSLIEHQVSVHLQRSEQHHRDELSGLISIVITPLAQGNDAPEFSDIRLARYCLFFAPVLPPVERASLMAILDDILHPSDRAVSAQHLSNIKQKIQPLFINLKATLAYQRASFLDEQNEFSQKKEGEGIAESTELERGVVNSDLSLQEPQAHRHESDNVTHTSGHYDESEAATKEASDALSESRETTLLKGVEGKELKGKGLEGQELEGKELNRKKVDANKPARAELAGVENSNTVQKHWINQASKTTDFEASLSANDHEKANKKADNKQINAPVEGDAALMHQEHVTQQDSILNLQLSSNQGRSEGQSETQASTEQPVSTNDLAEQGATDSSEVMDTLSISESALLEIAQFAGVDHAIRKVFALYSDRERARLTIALVHSWHQLEAALRLTADQGDKSEGVFALLSDWMERFSPSFKAEKSRAFSQVDAEQKQNSAKPFLGKALIDLSSTFSNPETQSNSETLQHLENEAEQGTNDTLIDDSIKEGDIESLSLESKQLAEPVNQQASPPQTLHHVIPQELQQRQTERLAQQMVDTLPLDASKQGVEKIIHELSKAIIIEDQYTFDGGLIILWPFLPTLFERLGLLQETIQEDNKVTKVFASQAAQAKAYALLFFLLGIEETAGYLGTANVIVGYELDAVVIEPVALTDTEREEASQLLSVVIGRWSILKNMPHDSFQMLFLQRKAKISLSEVGVNIEVEKQTLDILMQKMPWGLGMVQFPWIKDCMVSVDWPY